MMSTYSVIIMPAIDEDIFISLYLRYRPAVVRCCRRIVGNDSDAQDLTHEVFLRLLSHPDIIASNDEPLAWLYRVAINLSISHLNKARRRADLRALQSRFLQPHAPREFHPELLHDNDLSRKLLSLVGETTKEIVICRLVMGMTHAETMEVVGTTRPTNIAHTNRFIETANRYIQAQGLALCSM